MPKPRRDPRQQPKLWTATDLQGREADSRRLHGVYVDGVQTDGARAAQNRAMVARMRAAEKAAAAAHPDHRHDRRVATGPGILLRQMQEQRYANAHPAAEAEEAEEAMGAEEEEG